MATVGDSAGIETIRASFVMDLIIALVKTSMVIILFYLIAFQTDILTYALMIFLSAFIFISAIGNWSKMITYLNASIKYKKPYMRSSKTCPFLLLSFLNLRCKASILEQYEWLVMEKCHFENGWKACWPTKAPLLLDILNDELSSIEATTQAAMYLGIMENPDALPRVLELVDELDTLHELGKNVGSIRSILISSLGNYLRSTDDPELLRKVAVVLLTNQGKHGRIIDARISEACVLAGKSLINPFKELLSIPLYDTSESIVNINETTDENEDIRTDKLINIHNKEFITKMLFALAGNYPEEIFNALVNQENLESDLVRSFRIKALYTTMKIESIPLIVDMLLDEDDLVVAEARKGLVKYGLVSLRNLVDILFDEGTSDDLFDEVAATIESFELRTVMKYLQDIKVEDEQKFLDVLELARNNDIKILLPDITPEKQ
ncbi:MAG: hypothetical protein ACXAEU_16635 [Candidatus Hodarchaeales archaeon]|jgi:hypothetical protein